jgi:hypothetical protein
MLRSSSNSTIDLLLWYEAVDLIGSDCFSDPQSSCNKATTTSDRYSRSNGGVDPHEIVRLVLRIAPEVQELRVSGVDVDRRCREIESHRLIHAKRG